MSHPIIIWIKHHPFQTLGRAFWILFNVVTAAVGGAALAWGPLGASIPVAAVVSAVTGLGMGALWFRQQRAAILGQTRKAFTAKRWLLGGMLTVFLCSGGIAAIQLYSVGFFPPLSRDFSRNFSRLTRAIGRTYPYFALKGVDWERIVNRYESEVEQVTTVTDYNAVVASMLAELNDAHTNLTPSQIYDTTCGFAFTREIEGQAMVSVVGPDAQEAGLSIGSVILTVDNQPIAGRLEAVDPRLRIGSTPWQRRQRAFERLLTLSPGQSQTITYRKPDRTEQSATLSCPEDRASQSAGGEAVFWSYLEPIVKGKIVSRRLPSGLGYIRIPTFGRRPRDVKAFDAHLDSLMDTPGLIIDLRGNGGGSTFYADPIAGRLIEEPFNYGYFEFRRRLPLYVWRRKVPLNIRPRQPVYTGPVILLIDGSNMSTTESFIASLVDSGRAQTVGRQTAGASGNPVHFQLVGGRQARFSTGNLYRGNGIFIEGVGIEPDIEVTWTLEDVYAERDPDMIKAEAILLDAHP
jgi:carboxyl-terminal processing protease